MRVEGDGPNFNWLVGGYYAKDTIKDTNRTLLGENANVGLLRAVTAQLLPTPLNTFGYTLADAATTFRTYKDEGYFDTYRWSVFGNADYAFSDVFKLTHLLLECGGEQREHRRALPGTGAYLRRDGQLPLLIRWGEEGAGAGRAIETVALVPPPR